METIEISKDDCKNGNALRYSKSDTEVFSIRSRKEDEKQLRITTEINGTTASHKNRTKELDIDMSVSELVVFVQILLSSKEGTKTKLSIKLEL